MYLSAETVDLPWHGRHPRLAGPKQVVVVGGGLAGVAAAVVLAERGAQVTLLEREPELGGRVSGWADRLADGTPFEMERGLHAFFRQYYNLRALIRRVDPDLRGLVRLDDYPILGEGGAALYFANLPKLPPFNAIALMQRTPFLKWRELLQVDYSIGSALLRYDPEKTYARFDAMSAREFLDALNLPRKPRQLLFDVFAHSFFNPEDQLSAAEMLMTFHFYFMGNPEGLGFDVFNEGYGRCLWRPFQRYLEGLGGRVRLQREVQGLEALPGGRWRVVCEGDEPAIEADGVVLAVTVPGLQRIVAASPALQQGEWHRSIEGLSLTLPFAVWRLWLDRPVAPGRSPFVSTTGMGELDSITLYHLFQADSRRWALETGGSVIELHGYAVPADWDEAAIKRDLLPGLHRLYPETRGARILEERFLLRQDCPAFPTGSWASRPGTETPWPSLALAGDMIRLPMPSALMERAAASGFIAANCLLSRWEVEGEVVRSVPRQGLLSWL